jgi:preprotein translocase SecE subunit
VPARGDGRAAAGAGQPAGQPNGAPAQPNGAPAQPNGAPEPLAESDALAAPDPLEHAMPDVELAEAQLELGDEVDYVDEEELDELAKELPSRRRGEIAVPSADGGVTTRRPSVASRLVTFLQGSWAELQRVQWPDRRQVVQATGVVIGFVIVAGVFLGVADTIASHLMDWILK